MSLPSMDASFQLKKPTIKPYIKHLIKENLVYMVIGVGLVALTGFILPFTLGKYFEYQAKITGLENDINTLNAKARTLETVLAQTPTDLSEYVTITKSLVPDVEDYFSVMYALEELSRKTGFNIVSYKVQLTSTQKGVLSLTIKGVGNPDSFLEFLKNYNFGGGRLITAQSINLIGQETDEVNLNVNFYSSPVDIKESGGLNYTRSLERIEEIRSKTSFVVQQPVVEETVSTEPDDTFDSEPTKTNLF